MMNCKSPVKMIKKMDSLLQPGIDLAFSVIGLTSKSSFLSFQSRQTMKKFKIYKLGFLDVSLFTM